MKLDKLIIAILAGVVLVGCGNKDAATTTSGSDSNATTGSTSPVDTSKEYTLKVNLNKGDKFAFDVNMQMTADVSGVTDPATKKQLEAMGASDSKLNASATENSEVTEVKDGKFTISNTYADPKVEATGLFKGFPGMTPDTMTIDEHGVTSKESGGNDMSAVLPEKAVKVGDTWDSEVNGKKVTGKLVGVEQVNGKDALKVEYTGMGSEDMAFDGPVLVWLDPEKGIPVKMEGKVNMDKQGIKMTGEMSRTLKG